MWRVVLVGLAALVGACQAEPGPTTIPVPPPFPEAAVETAPPGDTIPELPGERDAVVVAAEGVLAVWDGATWIQAQGAVPIAGGERYQVHAVGREPSVAVGDAPVAGCGLIEGSLEVRMRPDLLPSEVAGLAVAAPWDVTPHPVTAVEPDEEDRHVVARLLTELGVTDPNPGFPQLYEVDVDGDGAAERFGVAERLSNPNFTPAADGDYSLAYTRRHETSAGEVPAQLLDAFVVRLDERGSPDVEPASLRYQAFVDADGDGVDEVGLGVRFSEGSGAWLFDRDRAGVFSAVATIGCGG